LKNKPLYVGKRKEYMYIFLLLTSRIIRQYKLPQAIA